MAYLGNSPLNRLYSTQAIVLSQGQTTINVSYTPGLCLVFKNGALLDPGTDYTATNGSVITLANATSAGDVLRVINLSQFAVANALALAGGIMSGPVTLSGGDIGVTLPQFDSSTEIATAAFVQRALGNFSGRQSLTASAAIPASSAGLMLVDAASGSAASYTLPAANAVPAGAAINLQSINSFGCNVLRAGTDVINVGGPSGNNQLTSIILKVGDTITLVSDGTGTWFVQSGTAQLPFSGLFGNSLVSSGYQKLPGGLILQWGTVTANAAAATGWETTFTLPVTFPNAGLVAGGNYKSGIKVSGAYAVNVSFNSPSILAVVLDGAGSAEPSGSQSAFVWAIGY